MPTGSHTREQRRAGCHSACSSEVRPTEHVIGQHVSERLGTGIGFLPQATDSGLRAWRAVVGAHNVYAHINGTGLPSIVRRADDAVHVESVDAGRST
jgi:hypothetical protein